MCTSSCLVTAYPYKRLDNEKVYMCAAACFTGRSTLQFLEDNECKDRCTSGFYYYSETDQNRFLCTTEDKCTLQFSNKTHSKYYDSKTPQLQCVQLCPEQYPFIAEKQCVDQCPNQ